MGGPEERFKIDVASRGPVSAVFAGPADAVASLVVAHGAGAGMDHPFLTGFTRAINDLGVATLRFNFPYLEAGRPPTHPAPLAAPPRRPAFEAGRGTARTSQP